MNELEKLYSLLSREGYYTKSFEEFKLKYDQDPEYRKKVFDVVSRDGFFTKSEDDFFQKYTPATEVKKKEDTDLPSEDGSSEPQDSWSNQLLNQLKLGSVELGEAIASTPETLYRLASVPQNFLADVLDVPELKTSPEKFGEFVGVKNKILDFYEKEGEKLSSEVELYSLENYEKQGIIESFQAGNYSDGFAQLSEGLVRSAPFSLSIMAGGAATSLPRLSAGSTLVFMGPEIKEQEEKGKSEIEAIGNAFTIAAAETVFSSIGSGTIGNVYKDLILKEGIDQGKEIFRKGLIDMYKSALKKYGIAAGALGEGIEEVATSITQNLANGLPAFENVGDAFIQGFAGGGVYTSPISASNARNFVQSEIAKNKVNKILDGTDYTDVLEVLKDAKNVDDATVEVVKTKNSDKLFSREVKNKVDSGDITKEEASGLIKNFNLTKAVVNKVDLLENVSDDSKKKIASLLIERSDLQRKIETIDDASLSKLDIDKMKEINDNISTLSSGGTIETEQTVTEEAAPAEPTVTQPIPQTVSDVLNRPVTLTQLGGSVLETPIEGDLYVEGQQVVLEDADGNLTEIGNIDDISDSSLEEIGIEFAEPSVKPMSDGNLMYNDKVLLSDKKGIKKNKRGEISRVTLREQDGAFVTLRGANAEEAAYQILLREAQSPEQAEFINQQLEQDEQFQNELRQVAEPTEAEADTDIEQAAQQVESESLVQNQEEIQSEVKKLYKMFKSPDVRNQVSNVVKSLNKIAPDVKIIVHETEDAYAKATNEESLQQKSRGEYNAQNKTIHINGTAANARTVYHEAFHAILFSRVGSIADIKTLTDEMVKSVMKFVPEGTRLQLENFAANYDANIQSEEKLAELFGILASEYKTLPVKGQGLIKTYLDKVAKFLGIKQFTDAEVVDLLNTLSKKVSTGEVIDTADVNILRDGSGDTVPFGSSSDRKQKRTKPAPKEAIKAYKLFRVSKNAPGKIFPLFVDANTPVELGSWIDADMAEGYSFQGSNGHYYIPSTLYEVVNERTGKIEKRKTGQGVEIPNDQVRQELIQRGFLPEGSKAKSVTALARRPGWHSGDLPFSTHLGSKSEGSNTVDTRSSDQVWAEVEMAADVDWQQRANDAARRTKAGNIDVKTAHITDQIPEDGFYKYKTNPTMTGSWIIGGSMKVNRILSDSEVEAINKAAGVEDLPRTKPMDISEYGFATNIDTQSAVTRKQKIGNFEVSYFEDTNDFNKLVESGQVVNNYDINELNGLPVAIHQPDNMFVGNINHKGKKLFEGQGGVFYTSNTGNVWASGKLGTAKGLAKLINDSEVDGVRRMVLVRGTDAKMLSSSEGVKAAMSIVELMVDNNLIPRKDFRSSLIRVGKKYNVDFSGSDSASAIRKDIEEKFMKPTDSTFAKRGTFFDDLIDDLSKTSRKSVENEGKIREFLGFDKRKIKFGKDGIKDAIGNILTERLLSGLPNSHVYAVIESRSEVIVRPATEEEISNPDHGSYPFVLVTKDGSKPVTKLLSYRPHAVNDNIFKLQDGRRPTYGSLGLTQRGMGSAVLSSRKQINSEVAEIVYKAKEEGISDEAIIQFLQENNLDVEQGIQILNTRPKSSDIWERSNKAIQDKVIKKDVSYYRDVTRELLLDRQARVKRLLNGIGSKEAQKAANLLVTKAGASGYANFRFKKADEKIFKGLSEEDVKNLDQIIYARRINAINENRSKRGLERYTGIEGYNQEDAIRDLSDIEATIGAKKFKDLSKRADEYFSVFDRSLERLRDSGIISEEVYQQLKDTEYSPIKTIKYLIPEDYDISEVDRMAAITGMNQSVIKNLSDENVNEVIMDSRWLLMTNLSMIESRVFQNRMLNSFSDAIESATEEERKAIEENVLPNPIVGYSKEGKPKYKYDSIKTPKGFVKVSFLRDGNKVDLVVREAYAKQLLDIKVTQGFLDKVIPKLTGTKILRFFATSGNPLFIIGNTAVDFANILFLSDVYSNNKFKGAANLAYDSVKAFVSKIGGTENYNKIYAEYMEHGGSMDYLSTDGLKAIESLKPKVKALDAVTKAAQAYGRFASYLGETSEISFRLAVYDKSKSNLVKEFKETNRRDPNQQEMEDIMFAAARESRETIDFSQGGSLIKSADKALPYLNAATQGFRKAVDYANSNPKGFASSMLQGMVMSASFAAMSMFLLLKGMDDDDDIEEILNSISDYEKANYHIIFTGRKDSDGEFEYVRIKKLPVISAAATLAEQSVIKAVLKNKGVDYDLDGSVLIKNVEAAAPIVPTPKNMLSRNPLVSAVVTYQFNYDMFYDQEIFRGPLNKKIKASAEGVYDNRVDQIYKDIAPLMGMSPKRTQAALEKIFTSESTNPMIGLIYSGYDTAKSTVKDGDPVSDEITSAANNVAESVSRKLVRKTNKNIIRYKEEANVEELKMEIDSKTYLAEQKVYSEIRKRYKEEKGELTNQQFIDLIKDNFDPIDHKKYYKKYLAYIKNINSDPAILDIIYESTPEVQAKMLFNKFGDSLESEEIEQIMRVYKASGRKISKKGLALYNQKYKKN